MNAVRTLVALVLLVVAAGAAAHEERSPGADYDRALSASQAAIGRTIGDYALLDQNGAPLRLSEYQGKPLVVSFIYTACADVCPTSTRFLMDAVREARKALGADGFNVATLGFNQPFDSPQAMAAFARHNGVRDPAWRFLSADANTMNALTRDLGFTYFPEAGGFGHISQVTLLDARGKVYRQVYGESFDLPLFIEPLKELLGGEAASSGGLSGVWNKVKLFCTVYDPGTGRYRVNYSLFIELFAGASVLLGIAGFLLHERRRRD